LAAHLAVLAGDTFAFSPQSPEDEIRKIQVEALAKT
jgi:hypothetical protein